MTDFVLIHGAYQGGWIWKFVSERLRAKGHNVLAPTLDGCGERASQLRAGITTETHGEEIAKLLYFHDLKNAVLVGTSSGGMVMACAAEQARERVARVVFADALALFDGERILDIVKRPTTAIDTPLARGPTREDAVGRLFASLDPAMREWAADRVTLHPAAVYNQPVKLERFWDQPWDADVLYCSRAPNPGEAHIRRAADKLEAALACDRHGPLSHAEHARRADTDHPQRLRRCDRSTIGPFRPVPVFPISPGVIAAGVEHKSAVAKEVTPQSAVAGWAIAVRAQGFTVRHGRTMRLSALLPLLGYRQLGVDFHIT